MHSRTHTDEQENCEHFLKICATNRRQIRPDGTHMSEQSWFGGVLGLCGGGLGGWQAQSPTAMNSRMRTTFVAHTWAMFFGTICNVQKYIRISTMKYSAAPDWYNKILISLV